MKKASFFLQKMSPNPQTEADVQPPAMDPGPAVKFPWLNLSGWERLAISSRLSKAKARFESGSLVMSREEVKRADSNESEESVGDLPIELRHLERDFCDLLPPPASSFIPTNRSFSGLFPSSRQVEESG